MVELLTRSQFGILWVSVALGLSLWTMPAGAQPRTPPAADPPRDQAGGQIMFNPFEHTLISAGDDGLLWLRNTGPTPETRDHIAPSYGQRYFVQLPGADDAIEVRRMVSMDFHGLGCARPDGSALLADRGHTRLCVARGDINDDVKWIPIRYPGTDAKVDIAAVYPDGVIVLRRLFGSGADLLSPLWWIPLRDTEPDLENAVRLSEPPGTGTRCVSFFRHADQIVWVDYSRHAYNSLPPELQSPPRLYVFDIAAGTVRSIATGEHPPGDLLAFDGTPAATGMQVVDITNAKVRSMASYTRVVGISRGALYSVHDAGDTLEVYSAEGQGRVAGHMASIKVTGNRGGVKRNGIVREEDCGMRRGSFPPPSCSSELLPPSSWLA